MSLGPKHSASLSFLNRLFLVVGLSTAFVVGGVVLLILGGISKQNQKDRDYEDSLRPSIRFIETFQKAKHRLPTDEEFAARPNAEPSDQIRYERVSDYPELKKEGERPGTDFRVSTWRGESSTYYFSWKKSFEIVDP